MFFLMARLEFRGIDGNLKTNLKILAKQHNLTVGELVQPALKDFVNKPEMKKRLKREKNWKNKYAVL